MLLRAVLAAGLVLLVPPVAAEAAPRVATTSEGVRLALDGRTVTLRVPASVRPGSALRVRCGAGFTFADGARRTGVRPGAELAVGLGRALPEAEWCSFEAEDERGKSEVRGAGVLHPRLRPAPVPVGPGPGVRTGTGDLSGDNALTGRESDRSTFLLSGRTLTVRLPAPFRRSTVVFVGCFPFGIEGDDLPRAAVAVERGRRIVTAELVGGDLSSLTSCLLEDDMGGGDITVADLGAPPGPLQTLSLRTEDMLPRLAPDDRTVFDLTAYASQAPAVGDIVLLRPWWTAVSDAEVRCAAPRRPDDGDLCVAPIARPAPEPLRLASRVVAVAGDRVAFRGGRVVRNGVLEQRRGISACAGPGCDFARPITVPAGHVYVAGDNRSRSADSRYYGAVPIAWVVGRYVRTLPSR